jgi:peptidyl-prolyl cis-trans isomerase D
MSILEKIRNRTGLLVGIVGLALVIFILESLLGSGASLFRGSDTTVGNVAGKRIDVTDYQMKFNEQINTIMASNPQANIDDNTRQQIGQQVWSNYITDLVIKPEFDKAGINVGDDELFEVMLMNPSQMVVQQLTDRNTGKVYEGFGRPDGSLDPLKLRQWVNQANGEQLKIWASMEKNITDMRHAEKYATLIKKGLYVTTAEAKDEFAQQNTTSNFSFVVKRFSSVSDSTVKVSDDDIQNYYKANTYQYVSKETTRKIEYVAFNVVPSEADLKAIQEDANKAAQGFRTSAIKEDSSFIAQESENNVVSITDMNKKNMVIRDSSVYTDAPGTVYGPYNEGAYFKIYKLHGINKIADSARVRHILIGLNDPQTQQPKRDKVKAKREADSLLTLINEKKVSFDTLVKTVSDDFGSVDKGGDYGWFDENKGFVEPFKNAGLMGTKGNISVVETQFGYHIIEVLDVSKTFHTSYKVAQISKPIVPSKETYDDYYKKASDFAGQYNSGTTFDKGIEVLKLNKRFADNIKESDRQVQNIDGAKDMVRWIYAAKKGDVSPAFSYADKHIVVKLSSVRNRGTLPLEEVLDEVKQKVVEVKKAEIFVKEFDGKGSGAKTASDYASKLGLELVTDSAFAGSSHNIKGLGHDDIITGTVAGLKTGANSKVMVGDNGVFVLTVNSKTPVAAPQDYKMQQKQMEQAMAGRSDYQVFEALKDKANIEDHTGKFDF